MIKMSKIAITALVATAFFVGCGGNGETEKLGEKLGDNVIELVKDSAEKQKDDLVEKGKKEIDRTKEKLDKEKERVEEQFDKEKGRVEENIAKKVSDGKEKLADMMFSEKSFETQETNSNGAPVLKGFFKSDKTAVLTFLGSEHPATWSISKSEKRTINLKIDYLFTKHDAKIILVEGFKSGDLFKLEVPEMPKLNGQYHIK